MIDQPFRQPVRLTLPSAGVYVARTVGDALHFLRVHWAGICDLSYVRAYHYCLDAMDGWVSPERARRAVVEAGRQHLLLR